MGDHTPPPPAWVPSPPVVRPPAPQWLATAGLVLGGIYTTVELLTFLASFGAAHAYGEAARQGTDAAEVVTTYDLLSVGFTVMLPLWIVSSLFLQRARAAAALAFPTGAHQRGPAWVWLGWVVPIVNLWFPYQVVRDVVRNAWRDPWGDQRQGLHLGVWWSAWVVSIVTSQVASRAIPWSGTPDADAVALLPLLHLVTAVATVVGFALWVRIVRSVVRGLQSA